MEEAGGPYSQYVDPYDVDGLVAAIKKIEDPLVRVKMVEEGLKWVSRFTSEQMARETIVCYEKVLSGTV